MLAPHRLLAILALGAALAAGDAVAPPPAGPAGPGGPPGGGREERMMRRMVEEHPELKGVDTSTPEGQEKVRQVMQAGMRQRMAEAQTASRAGLKKSFAMSDADFAAIEPLLIRVENLRMQKNIVDRAGIVGGMMGGRQGRGGMGGPGGMFNPQAMLGDTQLDPAVTEIQDALKVLKALVDDAQSNNNEVDLALARVRKARDAFKTVLGKAQEDLRAVLSKRQEAQLVDRGTLD